MSDIDLIPTDYRNRIWLKTRGKHLVLGITAMLVLTVVAFSGLHYTSGKVSRKIETLQQKQAITAQQREVLTQLNTNKQDLEHRLKLLTGLRSGAAAPLMFTTIDRALSDGEVWFQDWEFRRAGSTVKPPEEVTSNGYFIVLPASDAAAGGATWKIETHMTIKGQAKDHSALSRFVRRLYDQPEIHNIKILNTSMAAGKQVVDFNLAVTVNSSGASS